MSLKETFLAERIHVYVNEVSRAREGVGRILSIRTVRMVRTDILAKSQRASHSPGQAGMDIAK